MTSLERFYATIDRKPVDRPATWLGIPDVDSLTGLFAEYKVSNLHELKLAIGDDFYTVDLPYESENANAIYAAFDWYQDGSTDSHERTLTADGCFKDCDEVSELDFFEWPEPEKYISVEECKRRVDMAPDDKVVLGALWSCHFQDACAAFGLETAFMKMVECPEVYEAVDGKILDFYLKANKIFFEATKGKLQAILIGNDLGSQQGLMLSPEMIRRFVIPGAKKLIDLAHSYGIKVIYHTCGSVVDIIPDLIEAGADVIHPIQAKAVGMEPENLKEKFGSKVCFCGGVDTQDLLVNGSPEDVAAKVHQLRNIFPTGLIVSPSHEAILPDVPAKNIHALFGEATKIY